MRQLLFIGGLLAALFVTHQSAQAAPAVGGDLLPVFVRAHLGQPLRVVGVGGSITQSAGENLWIGAWLREQFPKSTVYTHNAGMSATGSEWAVYRLERDVIAYQPNLVFLECAVNDTGTTDEAAIRTMETLVVRLKQLPDPPAIFFVEAASRKGGHIARHQRVAAHYGLLDVNLDQAAKEYLAAGNLDWKTLFSDDVHLAEAGQAFYGKILGERLQPYVDAARREARKLAREAHPVLPVDRPRLPRPLSAPPLLLDAHLQTLWPQAGWKLDNPLPEWWNMFFQTVVMPQKPGVTMTIPFRGTTVGLFYAMSEDYGVCFASVDGGEPVEILSSDRRGYNYTILARDLPACEHTLTLAYPAQDYRPVRLGFLLLAGETGAAHALAPAGLHTAAELLGWELRAVPASAWAWIGPFGDTTNAPTQYPSDAFRNTVYPPEAAVQSFAGITAAPLTYEGQTRRWQVAPGEDRWVDFGKLTGAPFLGRNYAALRLWVPQAGTRAVRFTVDYYAKLWLNGQLVKVLDSPHGGGRTPMRLELDLRAGWNDLLIKQESGSQGNHLSLALLGDSRDVKFANPLSPPAAP
ncbi:MAG TPA: GDSL-type esterase/lipase family protein [Armatimonadota bacterium]|jgi:lysophospholipase L1-like esterase